MDGRALEDRAGGRFLRLRLSCGMHHRSGAAQGRVRRALHGRRSLRVEGDQGSSQASRCSQGAGGRMNTTGLTTLLVAAALPVAAETITFDKDPVGALPAGGGAGVTGRGAPKWAIETDGTAPSPPNVLKQSGSGAFPWCVKKDVSLTDGTVEVKFKPISGKEDAAGGLVWRWKDGDNYYVARANALEDNVSLYYTQNGRRNTIKYVDAPVPRNAWHTLRVEFSGKKIRVLLDGKAYIEMEDDHFAGVGAVGVWTKADSVTLFDDFSFGTLPGK